MLTRFYTKCSHLLNSELQRVYLLWDAFGSTSGFARAISVVHPSYRHGKLTQINPVFSFKDYTLRVEKIGYLQTDKVPVGD